MRPVQVIALGVLAIALLSFFCVTTHRGPIEEDLRARSDAALRAVGVDVDLTIEGRDATLSGEVESPEAEKAAFLAVRNTYGIRTVHADLSVKPGPTLEDCSVHAKRTGGGTALSGRLPAARTLQEIERRSKGTDVRAVEVLGLEHDVGMAAGMGTALQWVRILEGGEAVTVPGKTVLTGRVRDPRRAEAALLRLMDATPASHRVSVEVTSAEPLAASDLYVRLRRRGPGIVLSGAVADTTQRDAIQVQASQTFPQVDSVLMAAEGKGPDLASGAVAALPLLAMLDNGRLEGSAKGFILTGLTGDGTVPQDLLTALEESLPSRLKTDIATPLTAEKCQEDLDALLAAEKIRFNSASASISRSSEGLLDRVASTLRRCPELRLAIEGHTDDYGDEAKNQALSQRRARAVHSRLVKLGMPSGRATSRGFGEDRPIADNATQSGRSQNRRIDFRLVEPR